MTKKTVERITANAALIALVYNAAADPDNTGFTSVVHFAYQELHDLGVLKQTLQEYDNLFHEPNYFNVFKTEQFADWIVRFTEDAWNHEASQRGAQS